MQHSTGAKLVEELDNREGMPVHAMGRAVAGTLACHSSVGTSVQPTSSTTTSSRPTRRASATNAARRSGVRWWRKWLVKTRSNSPSANGSGGTSPWNTRACGMRAAAISTIRALRSSATSSPRRCCARKPVPYATSSTRAADKVCTTPMSCSTSADQPGRSRSANGPVPSHQSSYSAARWSKCARS